MCSCLVRFALRKCARSCRALLLSFILLATSSGALANTWTFQPGVDLREIYSDNISLAAPQEARDEFVTEVAPWFSINSDRRRLKVNLNYRLQSLFYASEAGRNHTYHQLNADSAAVIIENLFYFDANGTIGQQVINPVANIPSDNISIIDNRTNYTTYTLSPSVHHNFGASATADVRYSYSRVDYSRANQSSGRVDQYSASLRSGPTFNHITWSMAYSESKTVYDSPSDVSFKSAHGQLGYFVASSLNVYGDLGYEDNKYTSSGGRTSGRRWSVGFLWAPGPRTSLSASYGRRFFGNTYSLDFKHRSRLTQWEASYSEDITSVATLQLASRTLGLVDAAGNVSLIRVIFPQETSETFVNKQSRLSMTRKLRSGSLAIQFYDDQRLYQAGGGRDEQYGNTSTLSWSLNKRSDMSLTGGWAQYHYRSGSTVGLWYAGMGVTRHISRSVSTEAEYRHSASYSMDNARGYRENRISAYVRATF